MGNTLAVKIGNCPISMFLSFILSFSLSVCLSFLQIFLIGNYSALKKQYFSLEIHILVLYNTEPAYLDILNKCLSKSLT